MTELSVPTIGLLILSYLLGSVPFGLVLTRLAGLGDIRDIGSGNIGATNVLRTGRKDLALATLLLDAGKGAIAVLIMLALTGPVYAPLAGAAAFLGHCFPIFLRFNGGKGVATFMGTLFAVNYLVGAVAVGVWLATAAIFRISSLGALVASLSVSAFSFYAMSAETAIAVSAMTVLIYIRHHENIRRILNGTEPRIGKKKGETTTNSPENNDV